MSTTTSAATSMPSPMAWTDSLHTGDARMDETHQEFVDMINQIMATPEDQQLPVYKAFLNHTVEHFAQEERWMLATGFSADNCHAEHHATILETMRVVEAHYLDSDTTIITRMAEALAECLHHKVRTDLWGYAAGESLTSEDLIAEKYQGIRPAPGYPACPDHSAKQAMFDLLQCQDIGMGLTESLAMTPAASVSGFYLAHPQAQYFNVGKVGDDQVQDLAQRSGVQVKDLQRLLAPNL